MILRMTADEWMESGEIINKKTARSWLAASEVTFSEFIDDCPDWNGTAYQVLEYLGF